MVRRRERVRFRIWGMKLASSGRSMARVLAGLFNADIRRAMLEPMVHSITRSRSPSLRCAPALFIGIICLLLLSSCAGSSPSLLVDLRTDLVPGVEFAEVSTTITQMGATSGTATHRSAKDFCVVCASRRSRVWSRDLGESMSSCATRRVRA